MTRVGQRLIAAAKELRDAMTDRIDTPYCPDDVQGELGWIWDEDADALGEGGWRPCVTWMPDGKEAEPQIRLLSLWGDGESDEQFPADEWAGTPYLSAGEPPCAPGAPLMVTIRLRHGASETLTWEKGADPAKAAGVREAVLDVCRSDNRAETELLRLCLRDSLALHYASLRSDIEAFAMMKGDTPVLRSMDRDDIAFLTLTVQAIRGAEAVLGRALPADTPAWLPEAIDRWDELHQPEAVS